MAAERASQWTRFAPQSLWLRVPSFRELVDAGWFRFELAEPDVLPRR